MIYGGVHYGTCHSTAASHCRRRRCKGRALADVHIFHGSAGNDAEQTACRSGRGISRHDHLQSLDSVVLAVESTLECSTAYRRA